MIFSFTNFRNNIPSSVSIFVRNFLFTMALVFVSAIVFLGIEKVSLVSLPYLVGLGNLIIIIFLLIICPLSLVSKLRPSLVIPTYLISYFLEGCAWLYSLLFVIGHLGFWGILFCFLFQTLTPITLMGAIFKGAWDVVGTLFLWLIFTYLIRIFSTIFSVNFTRPMARKSNIIDVEANAKDD